MGPIALVVKKPSASAGNIRDVGLILWSGLSPDMATHSSILAWRSPWTVGYRWAMVRGLQRDTAEQLSAHAQRVAV